MNIYLKNQYIDPVCRMNVVNYGTAPTFNFDNKLYYFCAEGCRKAFMTDPEKYLKDKAAKKKGCGHDTSTVLTRQPEASHLHAAIRI